MAFVGTETSLDIYATFPEPAQSIQPVGRWFIDDTDTVPTQCQVINNSAGAINISSGTEPSSLGNTVTVAANTTEYVSVVVTNNQDLYVAAYATTTEGPCILTPGIEQ